MVEVLQDRLAQIEALLAAKRAPQSTGCVLWTGYRQPNGYGYINLGSFHVAAHRAALIVAGVDVPNGMDVCHRCDVRACIEPTHLYVGTRRQNMADCTARGRHNKPRGEAHWSAKLVDAHVWEIRQRRADGESLSAIAADFNIHHATVSRIARGLARTEAA